MKRCVLALLSAIVGAALATTASAEVSAEQAKSCEVHAAVMVAEMKAAAQKPMSADEISLVRQTAYKSCVAQAGGADAPTAATASRAATAAPAAPAVAAARPRSDTSLWGTLSTIFSAEPVRKPGNERLRKRGMN